MLNSNEDNECSDFSDIVQTLFRQCSECSVMFKLCSEFSECSESVQSFLRIASNVQTLFRLCSEFSVMFILCSEFLAQQLVYSEFLDFVVNVSLIAPLQNRPRQYRTHFYQNNPIQNVHTFIYFVHIEV